MRAVDIFSGCGGMSLGFEQAGFKVVAAFDNWKPAVEIYRANFTHPIYEKDLCDEDSVETIKELFPMEVIEDAEFGIELETAVYLRSLIFCLNEFPEDERA